MVYDAGVFVLRYFRIVVVLLLHDENSAVIAFILCAMSIFWKNVKKKGSCGIHKGGKIVTNPSKMSRTLPLVNIRGSGLLMRDVRKREWAFSLSLFFFKHFVDSTKKTLGTNLLSLAKENINIHIQGDPKNVLRTFPRSVFAFWE